MRDRVVLCVLATGFIAAIVSWLVIGRWLALVLALIAIGAACVVYRIEAPRVDVAHPEEWATRPTESVPQVDQ